VSTTATNRAADETRLAGAFHQYTAAAPMTCLGRSVQEREIRAYLRLDAGKPVTLVFGAFHGDEPKSVFTCCRLIEAIESDPAHAMDRAWVIVPIVNPDGFARRNRRNANRVDLNRNFPTSNWDGGKKHNRMYGGAAPASEPETRTVIELIEKHAPARIVTVHSIGLNRFCNNFDGPARAWAESMARLNGYPVTDSIGYPTPGSFGSWAGVERQIPTITLELPSHRSATRCWQDNREALLLA